ncbi:putative HTH-type transcriptional regulator [BD1-7 clade bacterium]|uniref:Putative HTH-type transcriptional regulator n=1 Tax=BD1-7 clade bacterium TaxID=2029982 RepID=A0A5S9P3Q8_9GAMM|nr:putative HTH-type transcriptional regulator [BD1-7 clade bacterium]
MNKSKPDRPSKDESSAPPTSRGAKRKKRTRLKLLNSAMALFSRKDAQDVTINDITEGADVGFGTFYNHFESKDAIYEAVLFYAFDSFGEVVDAHLDRINDPAEKISTALRLTLREAKLKKDWGRFLVREAFSEMGLSSGLAPRLARDIDEGISQGRFKHGDIDLMTLVIGASTVGCISIGLGEDSTHPQLEEDKTLGQRFIEHALKTLGLPDDEANRLAIVPLPDDDLSERAF